MRLIIALVGLALLIALPILLMFSNRRVLADFGKALQDRGFQPIAQCPMKFPISDPMGRNSTGTSNLQLQECFEGQIQPGRKAILFFAERHGPTPDAHLRRVFIGLYFPSASVPSDAMIRHWQERVAEDQKKTFKENTHAERTPDGGAIIVRHGNRVRLHLETFLNELKESLERYK